VENLLSLTLLHDLPPPHISVPRLLSTGINTDLVLVVEEDASMPSGPITSVWLQPEIQWVEHEGMLEV
jgi:hypothetical protein